MRSVRAAMMKNRSITRAWMSPLLAPMPRRARYLVAVSGGRDSIAMLYWLWSEGFERLIVCHLNHQLRGRSADADARFVERTAAALGLQFVGAAVDVRALAEKKKQSIETAARTARYEFFARTAARRRCDTIFVGHNADDLVETFLINLFRGAGPAGLGAMREISNRRGNTKTLTIVRPLLRVWRADIDRYVRDGRLKFRDDKTNKSLEPLRNRIRHTVLPYIEKELGRDIHSTIWRTAMIAAEEEEWLATLRAEEAGSGTLEVKSLRSMPVAKQRRTIQGWLRRNDVTDVGFELIERVRGLIDSSAAPAKTNLPRARFARRRSGKIFVEEVPPVR